jgi:hypothetical protein
MTWPDDRAMRSGTTPTGTRFRVGRTLLGGPVPPGEARRDPATMTQMGRRHERGKSRKVLRPVGRVRAAQQRARSRGDTATTKPRATPFTCDVVYEAAHVCFERHNDIEFSGERKRVRCNELLGGDERPH